MEGADTRIGPYRLEARLGAGGMGEVYRAYDERLRRHVALKNIRPERADKPGVRERFLREARTAARLNHPALVHIHDILETEDGDWIVMELVEGTPLDRLLEAGPLEAERAVGMALEIAGGLAAAHAEGIVHRDLKTENVVVLPDGQVKVLDFGLSKVVVPAGEDVTLTTLTADGSVIGTPRAMSPEQVQNQEVDHRSDLFSLGVLLYETVTGRSPFLGPGLAQTLARVCHHEQDPASEHSPDIPPELSRLVDRLLAKESSARPAGAVDVVESLERIRDALGDVRRPSGARPARPEPAAEDAADERTVPEAGKEPFHLSGEHRQLTVLCCQLTGAALDPEVLFEVLPPFQSLANEAIERFGGHLQDLQGHRLVACFGYPVSHEDNARRAVLAALEITAWAGPEGMVSRAGVHTGPAVILTRRRREHLAMGETLDLATGLQEQAEPAGVLMSAATLRLAAGFFEQEAVEPLRVCGLATPVDAYRVTAARDVHSRVDAADHLTPFVARERELALLASRLDLARESVGQAVLLVGEPGIGKTRLLRAFRDRLRPADRSGEAPHWVVAHGSPYTRNLPLHPVAGFLRRLFRIAADTPAEQQLVRLEQLLTEHDFSPSESVPIFAVLLGLPTGDRQTPRLAELRRDTLEVVPALVLEMAEKRPLVLAFEDLHQMDPTTLELVGRLIDEVSAAALLLILTCRPGFRPAWGHQADLTRLQLGPLSDDEVRDLIRVSAAEQELPAELLDGIAARSDGVPLFAEEIVRATLVRGVPAAVDQEAESVPATLRDTLTARLDHLGSAREVARVAAVLSREVSHRELVTAFAPDDVALEHELGLLLSAETLVRREGSYLFKRSLVREMARVSLLAEDRKLLQQRMKISEAADS